MAEKNILMQRKNADGTFNIYYPQVKAWDTWLQMPGYYVTTSFGSTTTTETIKNSSTQAVFATKVTTFNANGSITEKITPATGQAIQIVTVFNTDGSITQNITNV
ncbi:hypothetical protein [Desulfofalx alkaliphila]|uniref:hypothetical protein n=1 Tax=Desulfofalx alkaliphila TaxID=105483 RepID=UPI0004E1834E|nr:hypothetical protein [Desulfofalx alkaliphila]